jgi:hypothetical protein
LSGALPLEEGICFSAAIERLPLAAKRKIGARLSTRAEILGGHAIGGDVIVSGSTLSSTLPPATQPAVAAAQIPVDDSHLIAMYANFCRVTPEELIIDFGLTPQPTQIGPETIAVNQRIVTNYFTAKRILHALTLTLERYEAAFGVLETNVQQRLVSHLHPQGT